MTRRWRASTALLAVGALLAAALPARAKNSPAPPAVQEESRLGRPIALAQYWYTGRVALNAPGTAQSADVGGHTLRMRLGYGHRFARTDTIIASGLGYDMTLVRYRIGGGTLYEDDLHAPSLRLSVLQRIASRWRLMAFARLAIGSDMKAVSTADLLITGGMGLTYRASDRLSYVFGAMLTNSFGTALPLPLLRINYRRYPWRLVLHIPKGAEAWYAPYPDIEIGVDFSVLNLRYGLHERERFADRYHWLNVTAAPSVRVFIYKGAYAQATIGYLVRHVEVRTANEPAIEKLLWQGWFGRLTIGYML